MKAITVPASGVAAAGATALRKANSVTGNLGVNAMVYFMPVLSLLWLFCIADAAVDRLDYIAIGIPTIIISKKPNTRPSRDGKMESVTHP